MDHTTSAKVRSRREFLSTLVAGTLGAALVTPRVLAAEPDGDDTRGSTLPPGVPSAITVYKDPNCGCCKEWVKHIRAAGFVATVNDMTEMDTVKASMGVPKALQSCHTARIGSYVVEGHVPADVIIKLMQTKPLALGLAVPGMPMGSPGMEGGKPDKYDIMLFDKTGKARVFASR